MRRGIGTALQAAFAALGGGATGYASAKEREKEALEREMERTRMAGQFRESQALQMLQAGFDPRQAAEQGAEALRAGGAAGANAAPVSLPGGGVMNMSAVGRALESAGQQRTENIGTGRRATVGGVDYVQPRDRTPEGRAEREQQEALAAEGRAAARWLEQSQVQQQNALDLKNTPQAQVFPPDRQGPPVDPVREVQTRLAEAVMKGAPEYGVHGEPKGVRRLRQDEIDVLEGQLRAAYGLQSVQRDSQLGGGADISYDAWMIANKPTAAERVNPELYQQRYNDYLRGTSTSPAPAQGQPSRQPFAGSMAGDALSGLRPRPQPPRVVRGIPGLSGSDLELARSLYGKMNPDAARPVTPLFAPDTSARRRGGQ